jgi:hypothetical protein
MQFEGLAGFCLTSFEAHETVIDFPLGISLLLSHLCEKIIWKLFSVRIPSKSLRKARRELENFGG